MTSPAASCHGQDNTRIRLQDLPNLTKNPGDGVGFAAWPAYRVSNGQMWGMQQRLNDCYRQQRFPYPGFASDATVALGVYLGVNSQGSQVGCPGHQALNRSGETPHEKATQNHAFPGGWRCDHWPDAPRHPVPLTLTRRLPQSSSHRFATEGIVKASVLDTDETNKACSAADVAGKPLDEKTAKAIEAANMKTIKWPANGKFLGRLEEGEKLAQSGRGQTWTDDATTPNGGNCYNCHQIDKKEISFGTIGPSLYNFGKLRGRHRSCQPGIKGDGRVHLGQDLERQGLQRLLQHAARRAHGNHDRSSRWLTWSWPCCWTRSRRSISKDGARCLKPGSAGLFSKALVH
jgi:hypothetical protein